MRALYPQRLFIFTRYPEPGKTKTRLIPLLGKQGAADLHRRMAEYTIRTLANSLPSVTPTIYYDGASEEKIRAWLGDRYSYRSQRGADLGQRMNTAFEEGFHSGAKAIVLIGTDCPDLDRLLLLEAFERLTSADLVLGPAIDGGYYLIGLRYPIPQLFGAIEWGSATVLTDTIKMATALHLSVAYLRPLNDIDRPEDLLARFPTLGLNDDGSSHPDEIE
jgi:rSAM/selenodomain-associated transferase 1